MAEDPVQLSDRGANALQARFGDVRLTSKLIDGKFPDYQRVIPVMEDCDKRLELDRETLRQSLQSRGDPFCRTTSTGPFASRSRAGVLRVVANNPEQEQAEEGDLRSSTTGETVGDRIQRLLSHRCACQRSRPRSAMASTSPMRAAAVSSLRSAGTTMCRYVVMPMRL